LNVGKKISVSGGQLSAGSAGDLISLSANNRNMMKCWRHDGLSKASREEIG